MPRRYKDIHLCKIRRAQLQYASRGEKLSLSDSLEHKCIEKKKAESQYGSRLNNKFIDEVYEFLKQDYPDVRKRVIGYYGQLEVSIELLHEEGKIAIEPRSEKCYTINEPKFLLGATKSMFEMLQGFGWQVVEVSYLQWDNPDYKQKLLKKIKGLCNLQ
eukprot:TRINITY_DN7851_c0_g1_i3.p5 TRINITY_DN7851_c0_g1~~TRINITY_DN7851_c0_g1_i3.p5  ORF type:complete len:159 (+),score=17.02 TRINITY_DN7851_c0_g1_i3:827-1303(+)